MDQKYTLEKGINIGPAFVKFTLIRKKKKRESFQNVLKKKSESQTS